MDEITDSISEVVFKDGNFALLAEAIEFIKVPYLLILYLSSTSFKAS